MRRVLALCLLIAGCSAAPPAKQVPPVELTSCPSGAPTPRPLPRIRTVDHIAAGYNNVELAREATANALAECSDRLHRLNDWIAAH